MNGAAIRFDNVAYDYPDGTPALRGVNLDIAAGDRVGLVGVNGAGKSTLLLHLNGILRDRGQVTVDGLPVESRNLREIRRKVGIVFQNPEDQLFCPTVREDVAFGPHNLELPDGEVERRVDEALRKVGLPDLGGKNAWHLSFGQMKRAALATVLVLTPPVIALDEPVSNLDPRGRREMVELLADLPGTMIIATHQLDLVRKLCNRLIILLDGNVAADGEAIPLLEDEALLDRCGLL